MGTLTILVIIPAARIASEAIPKHAAAFGFEARVSRAAQAFASMLVIIKTGINRPKCVCRPCWKWMKQPAGKVGLTMLAPAQSPRKIPATIPVTTTAKIRTTGAIGFLLVRAPIHGVLWV